MAYFVNYHTLCFAKVRSQFDQYFNHNVFLRNLFHQNGAAKLLFGNIIKMCCAYLVLIVINKKQDISRKWVLAQKNNITATNLLMSEHKFIM